MNRRHLATAVTALAAVALLAGCSTTSTPTTPSSSGAATGAAGLVPEAIRASGELRIGNSPVYPPMSFLPEGKDSDDARIGFDVDLAHAIAEKLDLTPVFERQQYEQYLPSLATNRLDVVISAMQDLEDRRETATFVDYYFTGPQVFTTADRTDLKSLDDLCGKTVVVGVANTGDQDAISALSDDSCAADPITITTATDNAAALVALKQGRADANIRGAETVAYLMMELEPDTYATIGDPLSKIPAGIAVKKSDTQLVDAISAAVQELMEDGTYEEIGAKWDIADLLLPAPMVNGEEK